MKDCSHRGAYAKMGSTVDYQGTGHTPRHRYELMRSLSSRPRLFLVYVLGAFITGGSLLDLVADTEHWPFSPYRLVASVQESRSLEALLLIGVAAGRPRQEILLTQFEYTQPFDNSRLRSSLGQIYDDRREHLSEAVRDCLVRYEALRRAGRHHGPALEAMRLYRASWDLDRWGRNVDHPDRKTLLVEVRR